MNRSISKNRTKSSVQSHVMPKKPLKTTKKSFTTTVSKRSGSSPDAFRRNQLNSMPETITTKLPNGLKVASQFQPGELTTVGVFIDAGSRYETAETNGSAHFLEHILFKGTSKRHRTQLEMEIENMGGSLNAYTTRETTVFTATVHKRNYTDALDILSDILQNSKTSTSAIESERSVILEEMNHVLQDQQETCYDRMHETCFRDSTLAFNILGPEANIRSINKANVDDYITTHYTAPRITVVTAGPQDHSLVESATNKFFQNVPSTSRNGKQPSKGPVAKFKGGEIKVRDRDADKAYFALAFEGCTNNDPDNYSLMTMQMMLQSATRKVADEMIFSSAEFDAVETFSPFNTIYSDTGVFGLYAVASEKHANPLLHEAFKTLTRFSEFNPINADTVAEAKYRLQFALLSQFEGTEATCQEIGRQLLAHERTIPLNEMMYRVDQVTSESIHAVADRFFSNQDFVISSYGTVYDMDSYDKLRSQ